MSPSAAIPLDLKVIFPHHNRYLPEVPSPCEFVVGPTALQVFAMLFTRRALARWIALVAPAFAFSAEPKGIEVYPPKIELNGANDQQRIGVLADFGGQRRDLSRDVKITSSDAKVVAIENGVARPVGDGNAAI